jgi:hypothetical protein
VCAVASRVGLRFGREDTTKAKGGFFNLNRCELIARRLFGLSANEREEALWSLLQQVVNEFFYAHLKRVECCAER